MEYTFIYKHFTYDFLSLMHFFMKTIFFKYVTSILLISFVEMFTLILCNVGNEV